MNSFTKKLFNFISSSKIIKIIIIFSLSININCFDLSKLFPDSKDVSIIISPSSSVVYLGDDQQFTATAYYPDGSTEDVTSASIWTSTNTGAATISNSAGTEGLATAIALGGTKITAAFDQISDTTSLTVTTPDAWWDLQVTTTSSSQNMTIQMDGQIDITVDWGDNIKETTGLTSLTHTYASAGVYTMRIRGQASRIRFNNPDAQARLTRILSKVQGITGLTSFDHTFADCTNLTGTIPAGLFDNCPGVIDFSSVFRTCTGLTGSIPAGLFDNCPNVVRFRAAFIRCSGLTGSIPAGLFDKNPHATDFLNTFQSCSGLTAIPDGLFDNNPKAYDFMYTFQDCSGLTYVPSDLFDNTPEVTTFHDTFLGCTGITSSVPELWVDTARKFPNLKFSWGCFKNVSNASNWLEIPSTWGGPL